MPPAKGVRFKAIYFKAGHPDDRLVGLMMSAPGKGADLANDGIAQGFARIELAARKMKTVTAMTGHRKHFLPVTQNPVGGSDNRSR
jgi:hypothetical protein